MGQLEDRLRLCISLEDTCSDLYGALRERFKADREACSLWETLSAQEKEHCAILLLVRVYERMKRLPQDPLGDAPPLVDDTLNQAEALKWRIERGGVPLEDALRMALALEKSTAESYFFEFMDRTADSEVLSPLWGMYEDEQTHVQKIQAFMQSRGIAEQ